MLLLTLAMEDKYSPTFLPILNQFAHTVWGNPQALLRQLPQGAEFIDLSEYSEVFERLFAGILTNYKILIRNEYRAALRELQTNKYRRGAYVTGQPGIGMSQITLGIILELKL